MTTIEAALARVAEIEARAEKAEETSFELRRNKSTQVENFCAVCRPDYIVTAYVADRLNAELYAHARTDVPALCALVRALLPMAEKWADGTHRDTDALAEALRTFGAGA